MIARFFATVQKLTTASTTRMAVAVLLATLLSTAVRAADRIIPPAVPEGLDAPEGFKPFLVGHAIGTQNYICVVAGNAFDWVFIGPQATIYDAAAEQILTHFHSKNAIDGVIDATWQHSRDTSAVWARKDKGATVDPTAIEWLLLKMSGTQLGPTLGDRVASTQYIQRVNTVGGLKPAVAECTATTVNTRRLVYYEADYYFYK
jgi:hypothetical protein